MTELELKREAKKQGKPLIFLRETDKVKAGDYVEWLPGAWIQVDSKSWFVGKTPAHGLLFMRILTDET